MVSQACYNTTITSDGRGFGSHSYFPYFAYPDRRFQLPSSQDARVIIMTDQAITDDNPPRKRIAVACQRCRKRKIRCSGDPGHGLPCTNCKNAGYDPCLFLRVSSTQAELRGEADGYVYSQVDARNYAAIHRPQNQSQPCPVSCCTSDVHGLPAICNTSGEAFYRNYGAYAPITTAPSVPSSCVASPYPEYEVDYALPCSSQPLLHQDPVSMAPYAPGAWSTSSNATSSRKPSLASMYLEPEANGCGYQPSTTVSSGPSLPHRPTPSSATPASTAGGTGGESPSISFSVGSSGTGSNGNGDSRILPAPVSLPRPGYHLCVSSPATSPVMLKHHSLSFAGQPTSTVATMTSPQAHSGSPVVSVSSSAFEGTSESSLAYSAPPPTAILSSNGPAYHPGSASRHASQHNGIQSAQAVGHIHSYAVSAVTPAPDAAHEDGLPRPPFGHHQPDASHVLRSRGSNTDLGSSFAYTHVPFRRSSESGSNSGSSTGSGITASTGPSSSSSRGVQMGGQAYVPSESPHGSGGLLHHARHHRPLHDSPAIGYAETTVGGTAGRS